jgi:cyclic pyranopterin phosphate synthase
LIETKPIAKAAPRDQLGRHARDLRISVTDRCNFRCTYCMPKTVFGRDYPFLPRTDLLSFEEITRIARVAVANGVSKIRITGGEPLLRKGIEHLLEQLAKLPVELTLTTNGVLLPQKAKSLRDAGLQRVTVSLDAMDDAVFRRINDADTSVAQVLDGIAAAEAAGLAPIKVNCVVQRGSNDDQILPLVRHFRGSGHILRFIEYMDVGTSNGWRLDDVVSARQILDRIHVEFPLETLDAQYPGEVAERWRFVDGQGEIGVIASVTQAFCRSCTRLRLSTEGKLYTCLFATRGHDLRALLRDGADDATLAQTLAGVWQARDDRYSELRQSGITPLRKIEMSYIGG